jgi:putative addiction module killer protein
MFPHGYSKDMKYELRSTEYFDKWLAKIKDRQMHTRILRRIDKLVIGAFGDCKTIQSNLFELRMFFGSGYRVYYTIRNREIIILLAGGDKSSQPKDIEKAIEILKSLEE